MAYDCQIVDDHLRVQTVSKPYQAIDDALAWLLTGRIATVADGDMAELRRRLDVRTMLSDPEYAVPGELDRRVEAWPEKADRRIGYLERRLSFLEATVHRMLNADPELVWQSAVQTVELNNPFDPAASAPADVAAVTLMAAGWDACVAAIRDFAGSVPDGE
mgnify:FL=1